MEHRNGSRVPARLNVTVTSRDGESGWFQTLNLGHGGMAIRGTIAGVETNSLVTVGIDSLGDGMPVQLSLRALVVYQTGTATGLMWASDDSILNELKPRVERAAA